MNNWMKYGAGVFGGALIAVAGGVIAQTYPRWGGTLVGIADYNGNQFSSLNPMPTTATINSISYGQVKGFGTLAVTSGVSVALSGVTLGPNSAVWPTNPGQLYVINSPSSSGFLYVCPFGGTCASGTGIPISIGGAYGFYVPSTTMTVIAASGSSATAVAQW